MFRGVAPMATSSEVVLSHPLLEELKGLISRLKTLPQPIKDGNIHLVPFCETLELIFRHGFKQPYLFHFLFAKYDYWCWIEPLQDYYFNTKQNPLFSQLVEEISSSTRIRDIQGKGRCFIRGALNYKLLSVPIEHLLKNTKLTQYWYNKDSIIAHPTLQNILMELLFQATEVDFELDYQSSGFLDETWIIPTYVTYKIHPVKTLDLFVRNIDDRELIVAIDDDCLAKIAGVEQWDVIEEICGKAIHLISGRLQKFLAENSINYTEVTVVKKYLNDGIPFEPILKRQFYQTHHTTTPTSKMWLPEFLTKDISPAIKTVGENTVYSVVYLGNHMTTAIKFNQDVIDNAISKVLSYTAKPERVNLSIGKDSIIIRSSLSPPLLECSYQLLSVCMKSSTHQTCIGLIMKHDEKQLSCYVCETSTVELANCIVMHIGQDTIKTD